ncbi:hypothetical protein [Synechococcus sp. PCC 7335]|uniref:hypothetical protein n=1 Tax=Synechococcus sp. (strain ATCC 29403 / PCC 7335) TaxID=91464 RepID=UPI0002F29EEF|nr:hypothetical protein [Synechococcus sp. PCC 7335]
MSQKPSTAYSTVGDEREEGKRPAPANDSDQICWVQMKHPYHPDHQVELLHLQAEADALMIKLQAATKKDVQGET